MRAAIAGVVGLVFLSALALGTVSARQVPQGPAPATVGTGVISGSVTAADSGRPLSRVQVTLNDVGRGWLIGTTVTDARGQFLFDKVPAGSFTLKAIHTGFLDVVYGQKHPGSGRLGPA